MDTSRTVNMVLSSLNCDILAIQDKLEKVINSNEDLSLRTNEIKSLLKEFFLAEQIVLKFQTMITANKE